MDSSARNRRSGSSEPQAEHAILPPFDLAKWLNHQGHCSEGEVARDRRETANSHAELASHPDPTARFLQKRARRNMVSPGATCQQPEIRVGNNAQRTGTLSSNSSTRDSTRPVLPAARQSDHINRAAAYLARIPLPDPATAATIERFTQPAY